MRFSLPFTAAALAATSFALMLPTPSWSQGKQPPSCAAISFRPIPAGMPDGQQDAGLYRSRFGLVEVKGMVKGGQAGDYFVTMNNKKLDAAASLPGSVASCATAKHLPAPGKAAESCTPDKLSLLIDHSGDKRYFVLYGRQSGSWRVCASGVG